jgi:hypothetical protein
MPTISPLEFYIGDKMSVIFNRATPLSFTYQGQSVNYWGYTTWREDWICTEGSDPHPTNFFEVGIGDGSGNMFTHVYSVLAGENLNSSDITLTGVTCRAAFISPVVTNSGVDSSDQTVDVQVLLADGVTWKSVLPAPLVCGVPGRTEIPTIPNSLSLKGNIMKFIFTIADHIDAAGVHQTPSQIESTVTYRR